MRRYREPGPRKRLDRMRRRLGFDHNGLRREVDRLQWTLGFALTVIALGLLPIVALRTADFVYDSGVRAERRERATRHPAIATVVRGDKHRNRPITVTWTEPDGRILSGTVTASPPLTAGDRLRIWVDPSGQPSSHRARRRSQTVGDAIAAGCGGALAVGLPLILVYGLVRHRCNRLRDRQWDTAWAVLDNHHAH